MVVKAKTTSGDKTFSKDKYYRVYGVLGNNYLICTDKGNKQLLHKGNFDYKFRYNFMFWI